MANYLNIKDRSNSAFNPHLTPLHTGFSLIEVLITSTIGLVLGAGVLKLSQIAIENTHILKTIFAEQRLEKAVSDALTDQAHCKDILGQFHSKTVDSDGAISVTNDSSKTYKYGVKTGEFEGGIIDIQAIKLTPPAAADWTAANSETDYVLYYKKPRLGKYATLGGNTCSASDQTGCYFVKCKMNYFCSDNTCQTDGDQCQLVAGSCKGNNQGSNAIANKECDPGLSLTGFDSAGEPICRIACSSGRVYDAGACKCPGAPGELKWKRAGEVDEGRCLCAKSDGTYDYRKVWNGKKCVTKCTGINKFNTVTKQCTECDDSGNPPDYHWWALTNTCVYCPERAATATHTRTAFFAVGQSCGCHGVGGRELKFYNLFNGQEDVCVDKCEANEHWNGTSCINKCSAGERWFTGYYPSPGRCQSCPGTWHPYTKIKVHDNLSSV